MESSSPDTSTHSRDEESESKQPIKIKKDTDNISALQCMKLSDEPNLHLAKDFTGSTKTLSTNIMKKKILQQYDANLKDCLLYTSPSPRDLSTSRMPSSA
eukprot:TRINITY_DN23902_c0_g1_i3.p2 TRINITY_DN23902_c0_g1~~TRINITY_DN23902_c0_g1_i3.p2  ORF type:complete len:100 (-),score=14.99 TRINITY_DN23902_c0_g1_i3:90-389(-)